MQVDCDSFRSVPLKSNRRLIMGDLRSEVVAPANVRRICLTPLRATFNSCQRAGILPAFAIVPTPYGKDL
jgi:hypothetical protein